MRSLFNILLFILSLAAIGAILLLVFITAKFLIGRYENLDPEWSSGILIVSIVFLICAFVISRAIHFIATNKDKAIHPEKTIVYQNFIELWSQSNSLVSSDENLKRQIALWAADDVLKEYLKLERLTSSNTDAAKRQIQAEKIVLAMRRDLGNRNWGILKGELVSLLKRS